MTRAIARPPVAVGLAAAAGILQGALRANIPLRLSDGSGLGSELSLSESVAIVSVLALLSLAVLVGLFVAGYVWGGRAGHLPSFGRLGFSLLGAAVVGFSVGFLAVAVILGQPVGRHVADGWMVYQIGEAANGLARIPFAGMAGGAFAQYFAKSNTVRQQPTGSRFTFRLAVATGLAGLPGLLLGLERNAPLLGATRELSYAPMSMTLGAISLVSLSVTLGLFLAGYWWAIRADIPASFGRFTGSLVVASFIGHAIGMLPSLIVGGSLIGVIVAFGFLAPSILFVPLSGLAGVALAQSRAVRRPA